MKKDNQIKFPKLFVTDLDGTALGNGFEPYARFPDPFSEFLDRLNAMGCVWAINTTWDPAGQWQLILQSSVKSRPEYLMGELGYRLARVNNGNLEMVQPFTSKMESKMTDINNKVVRPLIKDICSKFSPEKIFYYGHLFHFIPIESDRKHLTTYASEKYINHQKLNCSIDTNGNFTCHPGFLKKSVNLAEVVKIMRLSPEDVLVAGDHLADIEMMRPELTTFAICPQNAVKEVKEKVQSIGGIIGEYHSGLGIIDAFNKLAKQNGWEW